MQGKTNLCESMPYTLGVSEQILYPDINHSQRHIFQFVSWIIPIKTGHYYNPGTLKSHSTVNFIISFKLIYGLGGG